jgi:type II secretory pathway component PulF
MLTAVRVAREGVPNLAVAADLDAAVERIARGERVAASFAGALPPLAIELMAAGEEGGRLAEMCARVGQLHEEAVRRSLSALVRLLEPALILAFGAIVGFIALAMLQAVYSVNAGIL